MKRILMTLLIAASVLNFVFGDTELRIARKESRVNSGFKERIYIDGRNVLTLDNGKSGTVKVSDGVHKIYAELYTMKTKEVSFNASGGAVQIDITANSINDFAFTMAQVVPPASATGTATAAASAASAASSALQAANTPPAAAPTTAATTTARPVGQSTLEIALYAAADVIIKRLQPRTTIAVVSIASKDIDSVEFVLDELAYVIVSSGNFKVVDRKSLDAIQAEQNFQSSGEVDDDSAVSIGKLLGANIVITGSITGVGSTRRLRLKALDVKTAEIVAMASEAY